jgi:tRNA (guanine-N7-)-methyltransferase
MIKEFFPRAIRSFVRRDSRMTAAQRRVLVELWPQFGLDIANGPIDLTKIFGRTAPCTVEIGFGSGHSLLEIAKTHPEQDFIGIETYQPGVGMLLLAMETERITNIRIYYADAVEVLKNCIPNTALDGVQIFFPDPWPKRRHHKRRLIQTPFVELIISKLKLGGIFHLATDWEDYANHMLTVSSEIDNLINLAGAGAFAPRSEQRPVITKFEGRGQRSGRPIRELQFVRR